MAAVLAVLLSLCASACWGLSDFLAGLVSRRLPVLTVMFGAQTLGLLGCAAALAVVVPSPPSRGHALAALAAGASGVAGLACFYRALAVGTMSVVAPIGATGVALPVLVGLAGGDRLRAAQAVGLVLTVCGVVLVARPAEAAVGRGHAAAPAGVRGGGSSVPLALAAAAGFGGYFVFAHSAARGGVLWLLVLSHLVILPLGVVLVLARRPLLAPRADAPLIALIAVVDLSATALYGVANRHGGLAIVAVAGSLYPAVTLLLARAVLHERMDRIQGLGVLAALGGVALLAGG
jgi:drug/metabolite transporter (DMT)-like permease